MSWMQLTVTTGRDRVDAVGDCLESHGATAVSLAGEGDDELLEPAPGEAPLWRRVRVQALLEPGTDLGPLQAALAGHGARLDDVAFLGDDDWQTRWRAHAARGCFGGRLWLVPRDESSSVTRGEGAPAPAVLRLDPGLAFGSGSHPTTRLCLEALAAAPLDGLRVLDFGCGSGILAVAACLLGAAETVAVDHDPQALLATRDNATYNQIDERHLRAVAPEAFRAGREQPFDVVVANILANPLVKLAALLTAHTAVGGRLVLSGVLESQESMLRKAYPDIAFAAPARESGWICLQGVRQGRGI